MKTPRVKMPLQDPIKRRDNFDEVALGLSFEEAVLEASRCLDCKNPKCVKACPVQVNIPTFLKHIINEDIEQAYQTIYKDNILPAICGRVCPQESQCEGSCILGIKYEPVSIGALERFVGDYALNNKIGKEETNVVKNTKKTAIIGSGPAGLACAAGLIKLGYQVDMYEALHEYGGVLRYGIPDFRLPKHIVESEIKALEEQGVNLYKNVVIGKTLTIDQLINDMQYSSLFIGSGAGLPRRLNVAGENLNGVYFANEFLTRVNLMKASSETSNTPVKIGNTVAVVGGGNVAMDAARTAKRLGAETVFILYRRDFESLPARKEEIEHAKEEGVEFRLLKNPVEFLGQDYRLKAVKVEIMKLGEPDDSGRRRPVGTKQYEEIEVDSCIISIGQSPNPILKDATDDLKVDQWGRIIVESHQTSIPQVFAGGDVVSGAATVILAMGAGKEAAIAMDKYMKKVTS
jgi:glutamate synthase (NADPH/NADH) small chain